MYHPGVKTSTMRTTPEPRRQNTHTHRPSTSDVESNVSSNANANFTEDPTLAEPFDISNCPSLPVLWDWNDIQMEGVDLTPTENNTAIGSSMLETFSSLLGRPDLVNDGDGNSPGPGVPPSLTGILENGHCNIPSDASSKTSQNRSHSMPDNKKGTDGGIEMLSHLSTRLNKLLRSSCMLAETAGLGDGNHQPRRNALIDDACFKSIATWLVHISAKMDVPMPVYHDRSRPVQETIMTTGEMLHGAFSASHDLLEILRFLQMDGTIDAPQSMSNSCESTSYFDQSKGPSPKPFSNYSSTVVRHLVMGCHTHLLNVYVAVLIAIQHDVDLHNSELLVKRTDFDSDASSNMNLAVLADLRPVLVVQLCSYLIERQQQTVSSYLYPTLIMSPSLQAQGGHSLPSPPAPNASNHKMANDLELDVKQRLAHLQETLRI